MNFIKRKLYKITTLANKYFLVSSDLKTAFKEASEYTSNEGLELIGIEEIKNIKTIERNYE